ncbi:MAG: 5-(carboxyamino)imidazole ribonucleotide synthase [Bacteroidota bacterium]
MANSPFKSVSIGILGGGQLGRMLVQEAINLNLRIAVLDPDPDAPCKTMVDRFVVGSFNDFDTVLAFGRSVDVLTVEIEHVNVDALEKLESEGKTVRPSSKVLRMVQDKGAQKEFYRQNGLPTAPFSLVEDINGITTKKDSFPVMQKLRKGGYDGKGVQALRTHEDLNKAFDAPSVLEAFVEMEKEVAVIVARNPSGNICTYPAVEMKFNPDANLVESLFSPSTITSRQAEEASRIAERLAVALNLEGILAVELFITRTGDILVNEIAPRPHNSGHATIEGNVTSQFEQHLRAILDLPLGNTSMITPSVMINLLGAEGFSGEAVYIGMNECLSLKGVHIHLYGKKITKPFRKMGHVTICSERLDSALEIAEQVRTTLQVQSA